MTFDGIIDSVKVEPYYLDREYGQAIYCGDCREILPDLSGDILLTSPQYGVGDNNMNYRAKVKYNGNHDVFDLNVIDALVNSRCKWKFINVQILAANKDLIFSLIGEYHNRIKDIIVWAKSNPPPAMEPGVMDATHEFIICIGDEDDNGRKFGGLDWRGGEHNVFISAVHANEYASIHKAVFPIWLPLKIITRFTKAGEIVIDGCCGIGTTLLAAKKLNRKCIGIEIEEKYCEIAKKRLAQSVMRLEI